MYSMLILFVCQHEAYYVNIWCEMTFISKFININCFRSYYALMISPTEFSRDLFRNQIESMVNCNFSYARIRLDLIRFFMDKDFSNGCFKSLNLL